MTPPSSDASEQSGHPAPSSETSPPPTPNGLASESRTVVDLRPGHCTCGCGNPTPSRLFVPGHNQRLRGDLKRSYAHAKRVLVRQALGDPQLVAAPEAAELLGPEWLAWVAPEVEVMRSADVAARSSLNTAADIFEAEWEDL